MTVNVPVPDSTPRKPSSGGDYSYRFLLKFQHFLEWTVLHKDKHNFFKFGITYVDFYTKNLWSRVSTNTGKKFCFVLFFGWLISLRFSLKTQRICIRGEVDCSGEVYLGQKPKRGGRIMIA